MDTTHTCWFLAIATLCTCGINLRQQLHLVEGPGNVDGATVVVEGSGVEVVGFYFFGLP